MKPIISVIIPCYNQGEFLSKALSSLLSQTDSSWEAIIVNDGSTDDSEAVALSFASKDNRIHYYYKENGGASSARNIGVRYACGDLIAFLDADDWYAPTAIEETVTFMTSHPDYKMFNLRSSWVDNVTGKESRGHIYRDYKYCLVYGQDNKVVIKRNDFESVGGFDESMRKGFEDWEFYVRLLDSNSKVYISENILYYYRINVGTLNVSSIGEMNKPAAMNYIYSKNLDKYTNVLGSPQSIYQWSDRRLPRLVILCQRLYQILHDCLKWR